MSPGWSTSEAEAWARVRSEKALREMLDWPAFQTGAVFTGEIVKVKVSVVTRFPLSEPIELLSVALTLIV